MLNLLKQAPAQMKVEDVSDLLDICYVFLNYTPLSVRQVIFIKKINSLFYFILFFNCFNLKKFNVDFFPVKII